MRQPNSPLAACALAPCLQLAWWHHWLQWPQLAAPSRQQNMPQYEALQRTAAEQALWDETLAQLIVRAQQGLESTRKEAELARQFNESMEWPSQELKEQWEARQQAQPTGQRRKAAANISAARTAAPPAPPAAGPWPSPSPTPAPGAPAARAAAAEASAAAAVAWASAAAGNEAAAAAAAQRADTQPAAYSASAAAQWDRAAAAWRAAYDSLEAAAQADPGSEAVQQAAAAVEAARGFRRQLLSEQR